jgi:hypothetical protein
MANYPSLQSIADKYKELAKAGAPVATGKLRDRIATSYKKLSDTTYSLDLNTIYYGLFWNDPHTSKSRTYKRPQFNFVFRAQKDSQLTDMIDNYVKGQIDLLVGDKMRKMFENKGYSGLKQSYTKK